MEVEIFNLTGTRKLCTGVGVDLQGKAAVAFALSMGESRGADVEKPPSYFRTDKAPWKRPRR